MCESLSVVLGAAVAGTDDFRGEVERVVMDPTGNVVRHVAVRPRHAGGPARLVPVEMFETGTNGLQLPCGPTEFEQFPEDPEGRRR